MEENNKNDILKLISELKGSPNKVEISRFDQDTNKSSELEDTHLFYKNGRITPYYKNILSESYDRDILEQKKKKYKQE